MEDVLNLLQVTRSAGLDDRKEGSRWRRHRHSEVVGVHRQPGRPRRASSQPRGPSRRPYSRAPTVKSEYRGRDCKFPLLSRAILQMADPVPLSAASPYKGYRSPWKGKAKAVDSDEEEGSEGERRQRVRRWGLRGWGVLSAVAARYEEGPSLGSSSGRGGPFLHLFVSSDVLCRRDASIVTLLVLFLLLSMSSTAGIFLLHPRVCRRTEPRNIPQLSFSNDQDSPRTRRR